MTQEMRSSSVRAALEAQADRDRVLQAAEDLGRSLEDFLALVAQLAEACGAVQAAFTRLARQTAAHTGKTDTKPPQVLQNDTPILKNKKRRRPRRSRDGF